MSCDEVRLGELKAALEAKRHFGQIQPLDDGVDRLVCASHRRDDGALGGNSFWIARCGERWILATWAPHWYVIPEDAALLDLCLQCLDLGNVPICEVPSAIVDAFSLVELATAPFKPS